MKSVNDSPQPPPASGGRAVFDLGDTRMTTVPYKLSTGDFVQGWFLDSFTVDNDWSNVPAIMGYLGSGLTSTPGVDPRTLTAPDPSPIVSVTANQTNPDDAALGATGGIVDFEFGNETMIALGGSDTADAPNLVLYLDSTGRKNVELTFVARDIEVTPASDDSPTPLVVQYRTSATADWTNIYYNSDVTRTPGPSGTGMVGVNVDLPADAENCATLEIRIMTTNSVGNDEWVGIDNIRVSSVSTTPEPGTFTVTGGGNYIEGDTGVTPVTFTITRNGDPQGAVSIIYRMLLPGFPGSVSSDDFAPGTDFFDTITFADGESVKTLTFNIQGDTTVEQ